MPTFPSSPAAAFGRSIEEFLVKREMANRQAMLDGLLQQRERSAEEERQAMRARQAEQDRLAAEDRQRRQVLDTAALYAPGDPLDDDMAARLQQSGLGPLVSRGQPTQGAQIGENADAVPQYAVTPGVVQFRGTPAQRQAQIQAEEAARQAAEQREFLTWLATDESHAPAIRTWSRAQLSGVDVPASVLPDEADAKLEVREVGGYLYERQPDGRWTKVAEGRAPEARGITPTSEAAMISRLQTGWDKAQSSSREMRRQFELMRTGLSRFDQDPNGASQAVLVTYQKILDPTSVVRESEYARSAAGISLLSRMEGFAERLARGGAGVPKAELAGMVETARQFLTNLEDHTSGIRARTARTAARYRIPDDLVFADDEAQGSDRSNGTGPRVGEQRVVNGVPAYWDGAGWLPTGR